MNFKSYIFFIIIISIAIAFSFFKPTKQNNAEKIEIVVGVSPDYHPFAYIDQTTNDIVGFDLDILQEMALQMNKKLVIKRMPFKSLIFALLAGEIDVLAGGITPTKQRERAIAFSEPYFENDPLVALHHKNIIITSLHDLINYKIVVNMGYTADIFLSQIQAAQLTKLGAPTEAIMALQSGSVDAFVCAKSSLKKILSIKSLQQFEQFVIPETGDSYAFAIDKKNTGLQKDINYILDSMKKNGILKTLTEKWDLV